MGECVGKAAEMEGNLDTAGWPAFELVGKLTGEHQAAAQQILNEVRRGLASDEHVVQLAPASRAPAQAMRLLETLVKVPPPKSHYEQPEIDPRVTPGHKIVDQGQKSNLSPTDAKNELSELSKKLKPKQILRVNLSWVIEEGGDAK